MTTAAKKAVINHSLARKLVLNKHPRQRISSEAIDLTAELLKCFILEARNRASVEAECEREAKLDDDDSAEGAPIKAHHITKIAAELLLDL